jgi:DNA (cytosine-5)-methyltransferase 1
MNELALFAGAGGGILGGHLLGWRTVCAVEWEPYPASVLAARQNDGLLPAFPIWDDVRTFDGRPWRGVVDVVSGGFPCQDISVAGKGAGIDGARSGMWAHMARIVGEVRPRFVFVENSPALLTRGLGRVLSDLATLGYDCRWTVLGAADVGAPHKRDRFWLVAHANMPERGAIGCPCDGLAQRENCLHRQGQEGPSGSCSSCEAVADANGVRQLQPEGSQRDQRGRPCDGCGYVFDHDLLGRYGCPACEGADIPDADGERCEEQHAATEPDQARQPAGALAQIGREGWWITEPDVGRVADGVAARVDRLKAIGNGQVPKCAESAWKLLGGPYITW